MPVPEGIVRKNSILQKEKVKSLAAFDYLSLLSSLKNIV